VSATSAYRTGVSARSLYNCAGLRTLNQRWLDISWHPQAARLVSAIHHPGTRYVYLQPTTATSVEWFGTGGLQSNSSRVVDLQFARRPGEAALWHLYVEIMGKYSNVILTDESEVIITAAHQVSQQQSSVRPIQTDSPTNYHPALLVPSQVNPNSAGKNG